MDNNPTLAQIRIGANVTAEVAGAITKVPFHSMVDGAAAAAAFARVTDPNVFTIDILVNDRITVKKQGLYRVTFLGLLTSAGADVDTLTVYKNGAAVTGPTAAVHTVATLLSQQAVMDILVDCNPGDYLELWQDVTGANNFTITQGIFTVEWLG